MRQPRPEAFDPTYKKKKSEEIDLSGVVPIKPKLTSNEPTNTTTTERFSVRKSVRSKNRSVGLPIKRRTKRYSFEFYEDQLIKLKQLKITAEMRGEQLSLSEMVRSALDNYLRDKKV